MMASNRINLDKTAKPSELIKQILKIQKPLKTSYRNHIKLLLHQKFGLPKKEAEQFVNVFFDEIGNVLSRNLTLKLPSIGVLEVRNHAARACRDFIRGTSFMGKPHQTVRLVFSKDLKKLVQKANKREPNS